MPAQRLFDDLGRDLFFACPPRRVVSLVPSETYNLATLGVLDRLVGRTEYCVEPTDAVKGVPTVGGTKNANAQQIIDLNPDLVLANQEENNRSTLEVLADKRIKVFVSFPRRVADGVSHLARLARIFEVTQQPHVRDLIKRGYDLVRTAEQRVNEQRAVPTFVPIWREPWMTINADTHISDVVRLLGGTNVFASRQRRYPLTSDLANQRQEEQQAPTSVGGRDTRYPRLSEREICESAPEVILLPDEPYAFGQSDVEYLKTLDVPAAKKNAIACVSGKHLCWPGAMVIEGWSSLSEQVGPLYNL